MSTMVQTIFINLNEATMDVVALLKALKEEWGVVSQAPWIFGTLAALMCALAYVAARWRYVAIIEHAKASNDALLARLHQRTEEAESNKDAASKWREKLSAVVDSDSIQLREKTLQFVERLRSFVERYKHRDQALHASDWEPMAEAESEEEKKRLWQRYTNASMQLSIDRNAEYERHFKVDSLMLKDELLSRLKDYKSPENMRFDYEHPINDFGFNGVANDLEKMAKLLK
ncbi:hypothetical protein DBR24_07335 [Pseudomonas sp. HMWF006]|nr:hypothetical protein DBR24_07335 [Pseudomonas sp. HMWF006]PTT63958.1 hypothetical protein DBR26_21865 [Pseudomonas sp. HMWF007]PTT84245.1 hypothetical protein DBR29_24350 [Pseudomonas sp. HMWF005]